MMDIATLTVPEELARQRVAEYAKAVRENRDVEDQAILSAYKAAARGLPIISLPGVIKAGGFFNDDHPSAGLPKLAVARANARECWGHVGRGEIKYDESRWSRDRGALVGAHSVRVPLDEIFWHKTGSTVVPHVPPRCRPKRGRISSFHILWEVEAWTYQPPVDPALLRHLRGDLWVVLATWDLTDLERAVLSAR